MTIWDTIGQERYRSITKNYYNNTDGIILLYAINDKHTFSKISSWLTEIKKALSNDAIIILVGHKSDLDKDRQVTIEKGSELAKTNNIPFYEASAKTSYNIDTIVHKVIDLVIPRAKEKQKNIRLKKLNENKKASSFCKSC